MGTDLAIAPPELETRVAILMKKADENDIRLPGEVAFFIASVYDLTYVSWKGR
ncbi:hypothetical protein ACLK1T_12530 [Escherichia coli]